MNNDQRKDPFGNPLPQNPYPQNPYFPNGVPNMTPGMGYPMPNYEQMMQYHEQLRIQQREYLVKMLKEKYPVKYAKIHSGIFIFLGVVAIALQIVLIVQKAYLYEAGAGIIGGVCLFGLAALALFQSKYLVSF